jgi:2-polyprenyl-3-methyl-5-hydroxy-6-metoxy-1,4-benzoquinol methylase
MTEARDNEEYWVQRHEKLRSRLAAVGDISSSEERNLELYALKKRRVAALLSDLGMLELTGMSVLDAGCGTGMLAELFFVLGADRIAGVDASPLAVEQASHRCPGGRFEVASLLDFDVDEQFDISCCIDVLYHVVDDENWLRALGRLAAHVKPGGVLILLDQHKPEPTSPASHVQFRTKAMYETALAELALRPLTASDQDVFMVFRAPEVPGG